MKKLIFISLATLLLGGIFYSCKKDKASLSGVKSNAWNAGSQDQRLYDQLKDLCNKYKSPQHARGFWLSVFCGVVNDFCGAAGGAELGGQIGGLWGAGIGAIVCGGVASFSIIDHQQFGHDDLFRFASGYQDETPSNPGNPYDAVGSSHNRLLQQCFMNYTNALDDEGSLSVPALLQFIQKDTENYYQGPSQEAALIPKFGEEEIKMLLQQFDGWKVNDSGDWGPILKDLASLNYIQENEQPLLELYLNTISNCDNLDSFNKFGISFENDVAGSDSLNDSEKAKLLSCLSLCRYSCNFWYQFLH